MSCFLDGILTLVGRFLYSPPYWDDERVPTTSTTAGSNPPTLSQFVNNGIGSRGVYVWMFSANIMEDLFFECQLSHRYKEGTTIKPHVHWSPTTAAGGNVVWGMEYTIATPTAQFPLTQTLSVQAGALGTIRGHQINSLGDISMSGNLISTMIAGRIYRDGANLLDTYPDSAALHELDFHFQLDTPGSKQQFLK